MDLWRTRDDSIAYLASEMPHRIALIHSVFECIDQCVDAFEAHSRSDLYARICGLTLLKAKHLAVGCYSLVLDGLGQEAGALMRPFIEYIELLTYFRHFPEATAKAFDGQLPKAGERAKAIDGIYKEFRDHLNQYASHSSYSHHSLAHLLEPEFRFRKMQRMVPEVLERNLRDFAVQIYLLLHETVLSLERVDETAAISLAQEAESLRRQIIVKWGLNAP